MTNLKIGIIGAVGTVVICIVELLLFPIMLTFLSGMANTCTHINGSNDLGCVSGVEWISSTDRTILGKSSTLTVVIVLFTLLGGMIGSVYLAVKSK